MDSPLKQFLRRVSQLPDPHRQLDELLDQLSPFERLALARGWRDWWARPEQVVPESSFRSMGFLTGRGWGKTVTISNTINEWVRFGLTKRLMLMAQDEEASWGVQIEGEDGLLAWAHPGCKAWVTDGHVYWENGAQATVFTPKNPGKIFGDQFDTAWFSELHEWPKSTRQKAWYAANMCLRARRAILFWDSNPAKKHPILTKLIQRARQFPDKHIIRYGDTRENLDFLNKEQVEEWVREHGNTSYGRMMLEGKIIDEDDGADFRQEWIDNNRRARPLEFKRKALAIDPAISTRDGTDDTGMVLGGQGEDDQIYVLEDHSAKYEWAEWGALALDIYEREECDVIILERNRGGDACLANLVAQARSPQRLAKGRQLNVVSVGWEAPVRHVKGTVYVKEVIGRTGKEERGKPVAGLAEMGLISFVDVFEMLEDQLTSWVNEPGAQSPNSYDAFVWLVWDLGRLALKKLLQQIRPEGAKELVKRMQHPERKSITSLLKGSGAFKL